MPTQKAIVVYPAAKEVAIRDVPIPEPRKGWVVVQVKAVGLNPTDHKRIDRECADVGSRSGCDFAGIIHAVHETETKFKVGDRIAGFVHGGDRTDHRNGAFGEYVVAKSHVQLKIPDNLTFEQAATLGVGVVTCGQGLYNTLKLPLPNEPAQESFPILIHGASTATGVLGVQYAKASGLTVIATCSPHNFDYVRSLGADAIFDYNSPSCAADIRKLTNNKLTFAWDCAGGGEELCGHALSDEIPSVYGSINENSPELLRAANPLTKGPLYSLGYDCFGEPYSLGGKPVAAKPEEYDFVGKFVDMSKPLFADGVIKPIRPTVNKFGPGLENVIRGLDELRHGRVRGTKLVYTV